MIKNAEANIQVLSDKAAKAEKSEDAMRFSQAAVNIANANSGFAFTKRDLEVSKPD